MLTQEEFEGFLGKWNDQN